MIPAKNKPIPRKKPDEKLGANNPYQIAAIPIVPTKLIPIFFKNTIFTPPIHLFQYIVLLCMYVKRTTLKNASSKRRIKRTRRRLR